MNDNQRRLNKFLKTEGFYLVRQSGKHGIWTDGKVITTIPKSLSDHRAYMNKVAEIRRLRRLGLTREFISSHHCH